MNKIKIFTLSNSFRLLLGILVYLVSTLLPAYALQLKATKVAADIYAFIGDTGMRTYENEGMNANAGFIVTKVGVVVIDSGSSHQVARTLHTEIRKITSLPVKYVINTGGQDHRWFGNGYFKEQGAQIIAARNGLADMKERGPQQFNGLKNELKEKFTGTNIVYPDKLIDQKETLKLGDTEIQILHYHGGHTPGDLVVWLPQSRTLFSGDHIYIDRLLSIFPFSNTKDWLASFEEIIKLKPKTIIPGHGNVCDLAKAQRETGDYLKLLRNHMHKAIDNGTDLQTAINTLDQRSYANLRLFETLKGGNASRVYLEMETE